MVRRRRVAVMACVLVGCMVSLASAQALQQVPADALVVVKVGNLKQASEHVGAFTQQLGLPLPPQAQDPLGSAQQMLNVNAGFKADGDLVFAWFGPDVPNIAPEQAMITFVPVSDYKAFLGNFQGAKKDGQYDVVQFGGEEDTQYMTSVGGYAALSPSKEILAKKAGGLKLAGAAAKALDAKDSDAVVYLNGSALKDKVLPLLKENRKELVDDAERMFKQGQGMQEYAPVIRSLVNQALGAAESALTDSQGGTLSLNVGKDGVHTKLLAEFAPDSSIGKSIKGIKNTDASLLAGLPKADYIAYGGTLIPTDATLKLFDAVLSPVQAELAKAGEDGKLMSQGLDAYKAAIKATNSSTFGLILDPQGGANGMVRGVGVNTGDAKSIVAENARVMQASMKLNELTSKGMQQYTYTPGAKTVDGAKLDKVQMTMKAGQPNNPADAMAAKMMGMIFGQGGMTTYVGPVDDKHVVSIMSSDEKFIADAVAAAKAGTDNLSKDAAVQAVAAKLPQNRVAVMYLAVDKMVIAGVNIAAQQMGANMPPPNFPPNTPPAAFTISTDGSALECDMDVPIDLIKSTTNAVMQMQGAMMRPGRGRPGGAGRPGDL